MFTNLGETRSRITPSHAFIASDGHVETTLAGWSKTKGIILISPQMGARFSQYFALMEDGGEGVPPLPGVERFIFVLEGKLNIQTEADAFSLEEKGYAYFPHDEPHTITASSNSRLNIFERRYIPFGNEDPPPIVVGNEQDIGGEPFLGNHDLICKKFLPEHPSFDMAVTTMNFKPGAVLPFAETHVMEHGMLMLSGGGIYKLNDDWYPITQGDVLWMGPYCPQWYGALGTQWSSYLLYKEVGRDVFTFEKES